MATTKTTLISNYEAKPLVSSDRANLGGRKRTINGTVELVAANIDATGDIVLIAPIRTNVAITSIRLAADDLDSATSPALLWDVGLYNEDGTAKDADAYASDITLGQSATALTEYGFEARNIDKMGQKVWQDADTTAAADPGGYYYIGLTVSTVPGTAAAGTLSWEIEYSEG